MKVRKGFVSNSSSSSFVINTETLSEEIIKKIVKLGQGKITEDGFYNNKKEDNDKHYDVWDVEFKDNENKIYLDTSMDNGYLSKYLKRYNIQVRFDEN